MVTYIRYCFSSLTGSIQVSILCLSRSCHGRRVGGGERGEVSFSLLQGRLSSENYAETSGK